METKRGGRCDGQKEENGGGRNFALLNEGGGRDFGLLERLRRKKGEGEIRVLSSKGGDGWSTTAVTGLAFSRAEEDGQMAMQGL